MKKKAKMIDPSLDKRWDNFVASHEYGSLYHHSLWMEVVKKSYGYQPLYFVLEDSNNSIVAGIPFFLIKSRFKGNRIVSLALSDYSDILFNDKNDIDILMDFIMDYYENSGISNIEIRVKKSIDCIKNNLFTKNAVFKNHVLFLDDTLETIKRRFHKSIRRNINKSLMSSLEIANGSSENDMKKFYELYVITRKYHGLLPQPYIFFGNLWNIMNSNSMIYLMFAKDNSKTIAGIVLVKYKDTMYYIYGGSNRKFLSKRPNHLLFFNAIDLSIQQGLKYFDFGRTSLDNHGLMEFKKRWGTIEYDITHFSYTDRKESRPEKNSTKKVIKIINTIIKKTPIPVLKITGNIIYKYFR